MDSDSDEDDERHSNVKLLCYSRYTIVAVSLFMNVIKTFICIIANTEEYKKEKSQIETQT